MAYQADDLLTEVRRAGSLPATATTGTTDADILAHADSEMRDTLVPLMLEVREEFYERIFDATVVSGTAAYRLNKRMAHSRINTVQWVNTGGSTINLARIEPRRTAELQVTAGNTGMPWAYYLEGSRVMLFPTPNTTGTLRIRGFVRPGRLALAAAAGSISISAVSGTYVLTITGHAYTTATPVDVIAGTPSFEHLAIDAIPTAVSAGTTITLDSSAFSSAPAIGDYVVAPDTSPFIQLPVELHPALIELTTARLLRSLGKLTEAQVHAEDAKRLAGLAVQSLTPRTETSDRKIVGGPAWRKYTMGMWGRW